MPDGARAGSADFPFPLPQDWPEQNTFYEDKLGGDQVVSINLTKE